MPRPRLGAHVTGKSCWVIGLSAFVAIGGQSAAAVPRPIIHRSEDSNTRAYWTRARIAAAVPRSPIERPPAGASVASIPPLSVANGSAMAGPHIYHSRSGKLGRRSSQSGPVADPTVSPFRTVGKLYGTDRRGDFWCSATVVPTASDSVILTAGHCLYEYPHWARRLLFVPALGNGRRPFGSWRWTSEVVTGEWYRSDNLNYDYGAVKLRPSRRGRVGRVVGEQPIRWTQPRHQRFTAVGYPRKRRGGKSMWSCTAPFARTGRDHRPGPAPSAINCNMGAGSSGGPWLVQRRSGFSYLNSVTSYARRGRPNTVFGPYLTQRVLSTLFRANNG